MEYGEIEKLVESECDIPTIPLSEEDALLWDDVEVSIWKCSKPKQEIFPPSRGMIAISRKKVYIRKPRSVRKKVTYATAGYPMVIQGDIPTVKEGLQWCAFGIESIERTGLTILLFPKLIVRDDDGRFEIILGRNGRKVIDCINKELESRS